MNDTPNHPAAAASITEKDSLGRTLTVQPLDALGQLDLFEAAGDAAGNFVWLGMAMLAAAVTEIDGVPRARPTTKAQIRSRVKELGTEGLAAVRKALAVDDEAPDAATSDAATLAVAGN